MRNLLIVFYHAPPLNVSGLQRILHFLRHLPRCGWQGHLLGVDPETAESFLPRDPALLERIPEGARVFHAPRRGLLDAIVRRMPSGTEVPDLQAGWYGPAVRAGRRALDEVKADVLLASGSPWTSLLVGRKLAREAGLPFVADFRDPWVGNPYAERGRVRRALDALLEGVVVRAADRVVANTEPLRLDFRCRYPAVDPEKFACVPNGFDSADLVTERRGPAGDGLTIRHMGSLYAKRDPRPFLRALAAAVAAGEVPADRTLVEFVGENHRPAFARADVLAAMGLAGIVRFLPPVGHREALAAQAAADAVLVLQPDTALQVPAKLFEAIGLEREVLLLAPPGATAALVREERLGLVADPGDEAAIRAALGDLWRRRRERSAVPRDRRAARSKYDAKARAKALAEVIDAAVAARAPAKETLAPTPAEATSS